MIILSMRREQLNLLKCLLIFCPGNFSLEVGTYLNKMGTYSKWVFIVMSTPNSCTAAVIMLILAAATALSLNPKS